jgi:hypothetical protein
MINVKDSVTIKNIQQDEEHDAIYEAYLTLSSRFYVHKECLYVNDARRYAENSMICKLHEEIYGDIARDLSREISLLANSGVEHQGLLEILKKLKHCEL